MPGPATIKVGSVCHEWNYKTKTCAEEIDVEKISGKPEVFFTSKLAIDADGAPRAYHPSDRNPWDNDATALDWLSNINVKYLYGIQGQGGAKGPAEGYYVSGTTLCDTSYPPNDTRRWVDAAVIPYFVLPGSKFPTGTSAAAPLGCIAFVVDTKSGGSTGAIYADIGHAVGEGSVALALRLGLKPFYARCPPKVAGFGGKRFFYLVSGVVVPPPWTVDEIQLRAHEMFERWGGETQLRSLFPNIPPLRDPSIDDVEGRALSDDPDLLRREGRDEDTAKDGL